MNSVKIVNSTYFFKIMFNLLDIQFSLLYIMYRLLIITRNFILKEVNMAGQIEKMNRMRKNILRGVLIGSIIAFGLFMYPTFISIFVNARYRFRWSYRYLEGALILWLFVLLIFITRYWLYKKKLRKDPSLREGVNDERIKLNWLRAYRFAFYMLIIITVVWKIIEITFVNSLLNLRLILPHIPWLILFGSVISLVGAFLYYDREAKDG